MLIHLIIVLALLLKIVLWEEKAKICLFTLALSEQRGVCIVLQVFSPQNRSSLCLLNFLCLNQYSSAKKRQIEELFCGEKKKKGQTFLSFSRRQILDTNGL